MKHTCIVFCLIVLSNVVFCVRVPLLKRELNAAEFNKRSDLPLYEDALGLYYLPVQIGNPPVTYKLLLNTISADLILFNKTCSGCQQSTPYTPTTPPIQCPSKLYCSCNPITKICEFEFDSNAPGPANGTIYKDTLYWLGYSVNNVSVGALTTAYPDLVPEGMDGWIGFSDFVDSLWMGGSPFAFWTKQNNLPTTLGICLGSKNPHITLGEDLTYPTYPFQWTNYFSIQNVFINKTSIGSSYQNYTNTRISTASASISFYPSVFNNFAQALYAMCDRVNLVGVCDVPKGKGLLDGECYPMTDKEVAAFPDLTFYVSQLQPMVISGSDYLLPTANKQYCLGVRAVAPGTDPALGTAFIQRFNMAYDPISADNPLFGFADISTCQ